MSALAATTPNHGAGLLNLEKELVCFICTEVLYQPLTLIDCLHTFCGSCLKEWFSHQYRKAVQAQSSSSANPYTCPTCRAPVKDVQRNAMINTFLEMFLAANPDKSRSMEEKAEMEQIYKPGEEILPKVDGHRRRDRRRREEEELAGRAQAGAEDRVRQERRREHHLDPTSAQQGRHTTESSRSRERRDARNRQRSPDHRQQQAQPSASTSTSTVATPPRPILTEGSSVSAISPPQSSPRHPDAVEARQRGARTVAHQASLISIVSASESGTGTGESLNEAQLMQEILAEGLLDGINVDELTEHEQDELSEIIAERWRQLHPERTRRSQSRENVPTSEPTQTQPEERPHAHRQSSRSSNHERPHPSPRSGHSIVIGGVESRSPTSFPQAANERTLVLPATPTHRRRASNESRRIDTTVRAESTPHLAARSSTDLSNAPHSISNPIDRVQHQPRTHRSNTEPREHVRATETWQASGARQVSNLPQVAVSAQQTPRVDTTRPVMSSIASGPVPTVMATSHGTTSDARPSDSFTQTATPSITCARCSRTNIQHEIYKHCEPCSMDVCLQCYRSGRGCNHWFGFGHAAMTKFDASRPSSRTSQAMELPHLLISRRYDALPTAVTSIDISNRGPSQLLEGNFCDRCGQFADYCFWSCDVCNEGEWGFCNDCVNTNHCCDHHLLPVARQSSGPDGTVTHASISHTQQDTSTLSPYRAVGRASSPAQSAASSITSGIGHSPGLRAGFISLNINTNCDLCLRPILPEEMRYHCPTHPTPSPEKPGQRGDYDICSNCYHRDVKAGRIRREDGPDGWRLCPEGHRMISIDHERDADGGQRRVILRDTAGGVKMTDSDVSAWKSAMGSVHRMNPGSLSALRGDWSWREEGTRRATRAHTGIVPQSGAKFPPDGGSGKVCRARWSYFPPNDEDKGRGELMFPKHADVREIEEINEEWWHGVYGGDTGLFPAIFVSEIS